MIKTVEEAITEATIQLETSSDHIEYHVIEKGSSGFFGIGSKPAVIEARKKEESGVELEFQEIKNESVKVGETKAKKQQKPAKPLKPAKQNFKENEVSSEQPVKQQPVKEEVKEVVKKAPANKEEVIARVNVFLNDTFQAMGIEVDIRAEFEGDDTLNIELSGNEMGILIGKRGRTLDSMQYLTSLVRRTKKTVFLEPMNPYERRVIHSALQNNPYVSTHSEGEEPYRKVVVTLKK